MRFRFRVPFFLAILFLAFAIILLVPSSWVSASMTAGNLAATPIASPAVDICAPDATTPCESSETSSDQKPDQDSASTIGAVRAVLFWMDGCPHCETVMNSVLPPLEAKYGDKLEIQRVEIEGMQAVDQLYQLGDRLSIPKDEVGVPLLLLGERALAGEQLIQNQLPVLIQAELARGGVDFPAVPEFDILPAGNKGQAAAKPVQIAKRATIYLFWGDGCPHCAVAKPFLQELDQRSEQVELFMYEVWYVAENQELFTNMAAAYGFEPQGVPTIFLGEQYWIGYNEQIQKELQSAVDACLKRGCPDAGVGIIPGIVAPVEAPEQAILDVASPNGKQIEIPILGSVDLSTQPLLVSTLLIAFVDGFNPCSIWVLTMLLALTLHTGSRKKVLLIGLIFLTVTAAIYGLFITGLFTMFKVVSFVGWIQVVVAMVALFFALVNIKDYFWYKEGVSFTISDDKKPGIFQRMRRLMDASQSFWGLAGGTVVLAGGVSLVEFSCTAGFPVLWSNLLVAQNVPALTFIFLLLVYLLIYQLDELGIFFAAVLSMRASKLEEKHGRILKLIGGVLMLALAGVMLINPNIMSNLSSSLIVFGAAFGATLLILLVHRMLLPRLGIFIGSEQGSKTARKKHI